MKGRPNQLVLSQPKEGSLRDAKMLGKTSISYCPGFRMLFQDPLSGSFPLLSSASSSWGEKRTRLPWSNHSAVALSSDTRFPGKNARAKEQLVEIALRQFFDTLRIRAHCVVFLIIDDTIAQKRGEGISP